MPPVLFDEIEQIIAKTYLVVLILYYNQNRNWFNN